MKKTVIITILVLTLCIFNICAYADDDWDGSYDNSYIYIANRYTNVRQEPNTNSKIMGALTKNCIIPGLESINGWVPINYNGFLGYIYEQNVRQTAKPIILSKNSSYIGYCRITGYDLCVGCCGKYPGNYGYGITASGTYALAGRTVAIKGYPYGSRLYIEGVGYRITEDTGGFGYNHVDVFCNNHSDCYKLPPYANVYLVQ